MKNIAILLSFVVVVFGIEQVPFKLRPENLQNIKNAGDACAAVHKIDPAVFPKVAEGTLPRDETNDNYLFCLIAKVNLIKDDGHLNIEKIAGLIGEHPLLEKFKEVLKSCDEASKGSPVETLMGIYRCYFDNSPILFAF